ncbi:MAG: DUF952 domain-containing protein [Halarsenatibacteraceae bacterium]
MITHITERAAWEQAKKAGIYRAESLETEGFIHCSTIKQVLSLANRLYKDQEDLVLLIIDENKVSSDIKYEDLHKSGQSYPHIYGHLNTEAVVNVCDFQYHANCSFRLPDELKF